MTDHPWRLVAIAFIAGASLARRRPPATIVRNMAALISELAAAIGSGRAKSWIDQSELLARA